jgi:hypothetical protein
MLKKFLVKLLVGTLLINNFLFFSNINPYADQILDWYNTTEMLKLESGNNWFQIQLVDDELYDSYDIYFEITTNLSYSGLYVELYYGNKSNLIAREDRDYISNYCLNHSNASIGWYYINIHTSNGAYATITSDKFGDSAGANEPNNRFNFATEIDLGTIDTIISDRLGTSNYNRDVDIYQYTASEPCMITVDLDDPEVAELSVYVGNHLVGSTSKEEYKTYEYKIDSLPYSFNHTHGPCYIKIFDGDGTYDLTITRNEYQSKPVLYVLNPKVRQLYSAFDVLKPRLALLGNGQVSVSYLHVRNGETYNGNGEKLSVLTNNKTFVERQFNDILPTQVSNDGTKKQNDLQFSARNSTGTKNVGKLVVDLVFDNDSLFNKNSNMLSNDDVLITAHSDSVEVEISGITEKSHLQMPQRPYRYRIYPANSTPCNYSEWLTQKYFSVGIADGQQLAAGNEYIVEVQVRDKVAENNENTTNDLGGHIITLTQTIIID